MTPYIILLFMAVVCARFIRNRTSVGVERAGLCFIYSVLVLFAGLRDKSVGTDTEDYVSWLKLISSLEDVLSFHVEIGYALLVFASASISDGYAVMLLLIAAIVVSCYFFTIVRVVDNYEFAFFIFICLGFYTFFFNGARQGIASAICFLALPYLLRRSALPYFILISFAVLFHKTAIVAFPLYFISPVRHGFRPIFYIAIAVALLVPMLSYFTQLAAILVDQRYAVYQYHSEAGGGYVQVAFLVVQGLVFLLIGKNVKDPRGYYPRLLSVYLVGLVPALASIAGGVHPSGVLRVTAYFTHVAILLWPIVFCYYQNINLRKAIFITLILVAILYFIATSYYFSDLVPYYLNEDIFS